MLKKQNRITSTFEYNITRKYGRHYRGDFFHIFILKPKDYTGPTKVGIVISNRFDKRSTKRNRIKRLFREAVRNNFDKLDKIDTGLWVVIQPKFNSFNKTYEEICLELNKVLQKASLSD